MGGQPGEHCCRECKKGMFSRTNVHGSPGLSKTSAAPPPFCVHYPKCPCTSTWNGQPGEACCQACKGGNFCRSNVHPGTPASAPATTPAPKGAAHRGITPGAAHRGTTPGAAHRGTT